MFDPAQPAKPDTRIAVRADTYPFNARPANSAAKLRRKASTAYRAAYAVAALRAFRLRPKRR
jgi:hypothetical protein